MTRQESELVLHEFLSGRGRDARGRSLEDVLALPDSEIEHIHDFIQWLFPLPTRSLAQPHSPILTREEEAAIRADPRALENLRRAAGMMLGFYRRTKPWLSWSDHNHLRISRIIGSLRILCGRDEARAFHDEMIQLQEAAGSPINSANLRYWKNALSG